MSKPTKYLLILLVATLGFARAGDFPANFPSEFTTLDGQTFHKATISSMDDEGVTITCDSGVSKVDYTNLPPDLQHMFKFDPNKAALAAQKEMYEENIAKLQGQVTELQQELSRSQAQVNMLGAQLKASTSTYRGPAPTQSTTTPLQGLASQDNAPSISAGDQNGAFSTAAPLMGGDSPVVSQVLSPEEADAYQHYWMDVLHSGRVVKAKFVSGPYKGHTVAEVRADVQARWANLSHQERMAYVVK